MTASTIATPCNGRSTAKAVKSDQETSCRIVHSAPSCETTHVSSTELTAHSCRRHLVAAFPRSCHSLQYMKTVTLDGSSADFLDIHAKALNECVRVVQC